MVSANPSTKLGKWVRRKLPIDWNHLASRIEHFPAEEEWTEEDQDKLLTWLSEQSITCSECGTRVDEWDPEKGGDINAYYPDSYLDPGCKVLHDAYDAERENRKDSDGVADMNGVRVRLVPKERRMKEVAARRRKRLEDRGELPERTHIPFYPFP